MADRGGRRAATPAAVGTDRGGARNSGPIVWVAVAFAIAVAVVALTGDFVWDDHWTIAQSPLLSKPVLLWRVVTEGHGWGTMVVPEEGVGYYRPLPGLIHGILLLLFGANPLPFRLLNMLLHAGATLALARLLARRGQAAAWGACIFAAHPALADAFGWCSAAPDLMAALFVIVSVASATAATPRLAVAAIFWLLALLSKESAVTGIVWFAVLPLLESGGKFPRPSRRAVAWFVAATAVAFALRAQAVGFDALAPERPPELSASGIDLMGRLLALNLLRVFLPIRLTLEPPAWAISGPAGAATILGLVAGIGGVTLAAVALLRRAGAPRARAFAAGYLLLMAGLLPVLQIVPTSDLYGGRFLYLPVAGLAAGIGLAVGGKGAEPKRATAIALTILCVVLGIRSAARATEWRSDESLFSREFARQPESIRARLNWAGHLIGSGRLAEARPVIDETERLLPDHPRVRYQRGIVLMNDGRLEEAEAIFTDLLRGWRRTPGLLSNLANAQLRQGRLNEGLATLDEASRAMTPTAGMRNNRGIALRLLGRFDEARSEFEAAIAQEPEYRPARVNLLTLLVLDHPDPGVARRVADDFLVRFPSAPEAPQVRALIDSLDRRSRR